MHNNLLSIFLPAVLLIGSAAASAAPAPAKNSSPTLQQMQEIEGSYALADGRVARIIALDDRLYVEVNKRDRRELVVTGPDTFATRDGAMSVEYKPDSRGGALVMRSR